MFFWKRAFEKPSPKDYNYWNHKPFYMVIESVVDVPSFGGVIVVGKIQSGALKRGETIEILSGGQVFFRTKNFRFELILNGLRADDTAFFMYEGDNCLLLLRDIPADQLQTGMVVVKARSS